MYYSFEFLKCVFRITVCCSGRYSGQIRRPGLLKRKNFLIFWKTTIRTFWCIKKPKNLLFSFFPYFSNSISFLFCIDVKILFVYMFILFVFPSTRCCCFLKSYFNELQWYIKFNVHVWRFPCGITCIVFILEMRRGDM